VKRVSALLAIYGIDRYKFYFIRSISSKSKSLTLATQVMNSHSLYPSGVTT
jgi:hypothetical protein